MEVGAIPSSNITPNPAAAARVVRDVADKPRDEEAAVARQGRRNAADEAARVRADTLRAAQAARPVQAVQLSSGGHIDFEQDEGTRVMKVLDSKDVLIYQVPPKGRLTLIKTEEAETKRDIARV